jgi:hypothetical protein
VIAFVLREVNMPRPVRDGSFYEFNRPVGNYEVGREIPSVSIAQMDVKFGRDVYTPRASDAKSLAKKISPYPPVWHPAHQAMYFPHYYPEGRASGTFSTEDAAIILRSRKR